MLILHGLGGSIESHYAKTMLKACHEMGWRGVFMHFRGCSGEPNHLARSYHSGDTKDLDFILNYIKKCEPNVSLAAVGYSLGANVLLKYIGEYNETHLQAAAAVSPPFDLPCVADRIQQGLSRFYQRCLMESSKEIIKMKSHQVQDMIDLEKALKSKSFWEFDDLVTAPLHGFKDVHHYYQSSGCRQYLKYIELPTMIIHAKNDPFIGLKAIPTKEELSPAIQFHLFEKGGHVGFVTGNSPKQASCWQDKSIPQFFNSYL